MRSEISDRCRD